VKDQHQVRPIVLLEAGPRSLFGQQAPGPNPQALAATAELSDVSSSISGGNESATCPNPEVIVVVPTSVTDRQLAADLLKIYFNQSESHPGGSSCGGVSVNAYNSQSQRRQGEATFNSLLDLNTRYSLTSDPLSTPPFSSTSAIDDTPFLQRGD
jgi:hypothetical protein